MAAFLNALHTSHAEQVIVSTLRQAGKLAISLVADAGGKVIGHVAVSPVSISDGASDWFGLGPISVLPEHQRRGVGSRLMREALPPEYFLAISLDSSRPRGSVLYHEAFNV